MQRIWIGIGLFVAAAVSAPASAQRTTGGITGAVRDDTGAVLPGVTVTMTGEYVMGAQTSVTNDNGVYRFLNLAPGSYNLTFELAGFATLNRNGLVVSVGMTTDQNVSLALSSVSESVTVTGASPVVDTISSEVGTNYDSDWLRNAPVSRLSFFDFLAAAPGVNAPSSAITNFCRRLSGRKPRFQIRNSVWTGHFGWSLRVQRLRLSASRAAGRSPRAERHRDNPSQAPAWAGASETAFSKWGSASR